MRGRVRGLFLASLAVVFGPLVLPERASPPEVVAAPVLEPVPVRHEAHPATYGVRNWVPERSADRLTAPPCAPARAAGPPSAPALAGMAAPASRAVAAARPFRPLPPARGPPELS